MKPTLLIDILTIIIIAAFAVFVPVAMYFRADRDTIIAVFLAADCLLLAIRLKGGRR